MGVGIDEVWCDSMFGYVGNGCIVWYIYIVMWFNGNNVIIVD